MSHRDIKEMAGSDTRRILVVILGSRSRYLYEIRFELIPRARRRETYGGRCSDTITGKPGLELLDRYCARHRPTVITPVDTDPWSVFPRLVLHVGCLVKLLVVVNAEWGYVGSDSSRRNSVGSAKLWREEPRGNSGEDEQRRQSMKIRNTHPSGKSRYLGIVPLDGEVEWSAPEDPKVISIVGVFPDVFTRENQVSPRGLLQSHVELFAPAGAEGRDLG